MKEFKKDKAEEMEEVMNEAFQIEKGGVSILELLDTMVAPSVETSLAANSVRTDTLACADKKQGECLNIC